MNQYHSIYHIKVSQLLYFLHLFVYFYIHIGMCPVCMWKSGGPLGVYSLLLPCEFQGLNPGHQMRQQPFYSRQTVLALSVSLVAVIIPAVLWFIGYTQHFYE